MRYKAISLFSGGLDSILAVVYMEKLGYEVIPVFFETAFFGPQKAIISAKANNINLKIHNITKEHMEMLLHPKYGYGKYMNPCIDCHGLMFKKAGELLDYYHAHFIISGEVLGQRPMSQRKDSLNSVAKLSGIKDLIIRPLSQKLLPDTLPIREGWVNKEDMLDIQGRNRKRQLEMAKQFGLKQIENPAGGCLLTDKSFSNKLKDLINHNQYSEQFIPFLKVGRHFRINENLKLILGRNSYENEILSNLAKDEIVIKAKDIKGPLGVLNYNKKPDENEIKTASSILLRYITKAQNTEKILYGKNFELSNEITATKFDDATVKKYILG